MMITCKRGLIYNGVQVLTKDTTYSHGIGGHTDINGKVYIDFISISSTPQPPSFYFSRNMGFHCLYIWDFFYTKQEERKLKLDKLNGTVQI